MKISPKGQMRYESIMQTALELFLKNGFEKTSLNDIVVKSGGSLASVYKFFKNKEGLFSAIVQQKFDELYKQMDKKVNLQSYKSLDELLYKFGIFYFDLFCQPNSIALSRLIISESYKNKELGHTFFKEITSKVMQILISQFEKKEILSRLKDHSPEDIALKFCAFIREPYHLRAIIQGQDIKMSKRQKEQMVKDSVNVFLYGICR